MKLIFLIHKIIFLDELGGKAGGNCKVTGVEPWTKYAPQPVLDPSVKIKGASGNGTREVIHGKTTG